MPRSVWVIVLNMSGENLARGGGVDALVPVRMQYLCGSENVHV